MMWCRPLIRHFRKIVGSGGETSSHLRKAASFSTASINPKRLLIASVGIGTLGVGLISSTYAARGHILFDNAPSSSSTDSDSSIFKFGLRDLQSEEAQWALYERWCKHYSISRSPEDMERGFQRFKEQAFHFFEINSLDIGLEPLLTPPPPSFADMVKDRREKMRASGTLEDSSNACSICFKEFCESDPYMMVGCKHGFHEECLLRWACASSECPVCSLPLSLKDPTSQEFNKEEWDPDEVLLTLLGKEEGEHWTPFDREYRIFAFSVLPYKRFKEERRYLCYK